jgi:hypothetical protein
VSGSDTFNPANANASWVSLSDADWDSQRPVTASTRLSPRSSKHCPGRVIRGPSLRKRLENPLLGLGKQNLEDDEHLVSQPFRKGRRKALVIKNRPSFVEMTRAHLDKEQEDEEDDEYEGGNAGRSQTPLSEGYNRRMTGYMPIEPGAMKLSERNLADLGLAVPAFKDVPGRRRSTRKRGGGRVSTLSRGTGPRGTNVSSAASLDSAILTRAPLTRAVSKVHHE